MAEQLDHVAGSLISPGWNACWARRRPSPNASICTCVPNTALRLGLGETRTQALLHTSGKDPLPQLPLAALAQLADCGQDIAACLEVFTHWRLRTLPPRLVPARHVRLMFIELHAVSAFCFLRGASLPEELAARAAAFEMPALALAGADGY